MRYDGESDFEKYREECVEKLRELLGMDEFEKCDPVFEITEDGELDGNFKTLKFKMVIPEPMVEDLKQQGVYEDTIERLESNYYYLLVLDETHYACLAVRNRSSKIFGSSLVSTTMPNTKPRLPILSLKMRKSILNLDLGAWN